jgi:hypothetical protein
MLGLRGPLRVGAGDGAERQLTNPEGRDFALSPGQSRCAAGRRRLGRGFSKPGRAAANRAVRPPAVGDYEERVAWRPAPRPRGSMKSSLEIAVRRGTPRETECRAA